MVGGVRDQLLNAAGIPAGLIVAAPFRCRFETARTRADSAGTGITIPAIADYVPALWEGFKRHRSS